jgi:hypothetical protein
MADAMNGPVDLNLTYRNKTQGGTANLLATPANYASVTALKSRLTAINATSYSAARLANMTVNDMVYAVRLNDDAGTI